MLGDVPRSSDSTVSRLAINARMLYSFPVFQAASLASTLFLGSCRKFPSASAAFVCFRRESRASEGAFDTSAGRREGSSFDIVDISLDFFSAPPKEATLLGPQ